MYEFPSPAMPKSHSFAGSSFPLPKPNTLQKSSSFRFDNSNDGNNSNSSSPSNVAFSSHVPLIPPVTKTGPILRRTGITRSWKEKQMSVDASNVGVLSFPESNTKLTLHGRFVRAYVEVMWVFEEKTGQKHRFSITTATKHTEVVETDSAQELDAWMLALQSHGCDVNRPVRAGTLCSQFPTNAELWFVLYPDGLRWFKKKTDTKIAGVVPIGEGSVFERQTNGAFLLEETGDEQAKSVVVVCPPEDAFSWCEDMERVVSLKHKRKCTDSIQEGYLFTCGAKHGNWKKRFCVLKQTELVVYKKRFDDVRSGTVRLPPGADAESMPEVIDRFAFWVAETGDDVGTQRHYFSTKNLASREFWLLTLHTLFNSKNNNVYDNSLKEGYLFKQNAADGVWVKKYFVLQKDTLLYATKRKHTAPDKTIDMNRGFEFTAVQGATDPTRTKPGMFTIAENGDEQGTRTYILHAKDNAVRAAWLQTFTTLLRTKDTRVDPNSVKEGYMRKQKRDKSKWAKSYFILTQTCLSYYRKRNDKSPAGEFPIEGCTEVTRLEGEAGENQLQFSLAESGDESAKTYYFSVPVAELRTQWMNALLKLIRSKNSKVHPGSSLEGYLWKHDGGSKKLYFVLCDNVMSYYKRRLDSSPVGKLVIQGEAEIHLLNDSALPFAFSVAKTGDEGENVLKICASDGATCLEWVNHLRNQASRFAVKEDPNSIRESYVYLLQGKEWHKRYYILESACLSIYTKRKDQKPFMKFILDQDTVVVLLDGTKPPPHGSMWGTHSDEKSESDDCKEIQLALCESGDPSSKNIRLKGFNESEAFLTAEIMDICLRHEFSSNKESTQLRKSGHILIQYKNRPVASYVELTPERLTYQEPGGLGSTKTSLEIGQGFQSTFNGLSIRVMDRKEKEVVLAVQSLEEKKSWASTLELFLLSKDSRRPFFGGGLAATFINSPFYRQPAVISGCVEYLKLCPTSVCLFSSPGFHPLIRSFIQDFENGVEVAFTDPKSVVVCLKVYLLMLDRPLISDTQVKDFAKALGNTATSATAVGLGPEASREQLSALQKVLAGIDVQYRISISIILHYLLGEINRPEEVEVTAAQVIFIWAPLLMRIKDTGGEGSTNSEDVRNIVLSTLLSNLQTLFPSGAPVAVRRLPAQQLQDLKAQAKSIPFDTLRADKLGVALLTEWCKENFVEENMLFLLALDRYRYLCSFPMVPQSQRLQLAKQLCANHIKKDAEMQLNISSQLADSVMVRFDSEVKNGSEMKNGLLTGDEFTAVEAEVHVLIATNEYPRFKNAEAYDIWIAHRHAGEKRVSLPPQPSPSSQSSLSPSPRPSPALRPQTSLLASQPSQVPPLNLGAPMAQPHQVPAQPHQVPAQPKPFTAATPRPQTFPSSSPTWTSSTQSFHQPSPARPVPVAHSVSHSHSATLVQPFAHSQSLVHGSHSHSATLVQPSAHSQSLVHGQSLHNSVPSPFPHSMSFAHNPHMHSPPHSVPAPTVLVPIPLAAQPPAYNQAMGPPMMPPPSYNQSLTMGAHAPAPRMNILVTPQSMTRTMPRGLPPSHGFGGSDIVG